MKRNDPNLLRSKRRRHALLDLGRTRGIRAVAPILVLALLLAPAMAAPSVFWVSEPVDPGETVLVFGDGFAGCRRVVLERAPHGPKVAVAPVQSGPRSVKFVLPARLGGGVFKATIEASGGTAVAYVNRPEILWVQGDAGASGTPGGFVRILGRCLARPGSTARVRLSEKGGVRLLRVSDGELFSLSANLPADLNSGACSLSVSAGEDGDAGWSAPVSFRIVARSQRSSRRVDVDSFGADGDDALDDSAAIRLAIGSVAKGGGTVFFPRGRYVVSGQIDVPPGVSLVGAGRDLTALCWKSDEIPPDALIRGSHDFAVEAMTLYAANQRHGIVSDQNVPGAGRIRLKNLRLRLNPYRGHQTVEEESARLAEQMNYSTGGGDSLRLGGEDIKVSGCDIDGGGRCLYLSGGRGAWIHDNRFVNGRWGWYSLSGNHGVIFERNEVVGGDLMSTGGGLNCLDGSTVSENVYFAHNRLHRMYGWDREAMTTDAGGGAYYGRIASASGVRLTLASDAEWSGSVQGLGVFILDGKGQGQYRQIVRASGREVELDRPWVVPPDASSVVTITALQGDYLFVGNDFEDAGIAIQMYGESIGNIAYGNVSARTGGFHNFGMNYYGVQPSWYVQWLHNRITDGNVYGGGHDQTVAVGEAHLGVYALPTGKTPDAPVTLCGILRDNRLDSNAHLGVGGTPDGPDGSFPSVQEAIVEGNVVRDASCGLLLAKSASGVLVRNNAFLHCDEGIASVDPSQKRSEEAARRLLSRFGSNAKPVLLLPLSEEKEGVFPDATGHGFDAVPHGDAKVEDGTLTLDGRGYLTVSQSEILGSGDCSIRLRVRPRTVAGRFGLISKRLGNAATPLVLAVSDGRLTFEATDDSQRWSFNFGTEPLMKAGVWRTVAVVIKAGEGVTLYLDGKPEAHLKSARVRVQNGDPLCIGREVWGGDPPKTDGPALFSGQIADVAIYTRALSPAEVRALPEEKP